jgi:hypothetical protein
MITGLIILEDIAIKFDIGENCQHCQLTVSDRSTGQERSLICNNEQLGAIVGTAVCGTNEAVMTAALPIAESAFPADWPRELRPMP